MFAGLVVEYTILLWIKRKEFSKNDLALTIVAGIAISLGVGGEYLFGARASDAATKLENGSEEHIADLNKEAGDARKDAGNAIERAAQLETMAKRLEGQIVEARAMAAESDARAKEAELRLAQFKAPRDIHIDPAIRGRLRAFAGTPYDIVVFADADSNRLATEIVDALRNAGWAMKDTPTNELKMPLRTNNQQGAPIYVSATFNSVGILVKASPGQDDAAGALFSMFQKEWMSIGILALKKETIPVERQEPMHIIIGQKYFE